MPIGEIVAEVVIRPLLEFVLYALSYMTGFVLLKAITMGTIRLAPMDSLHEKNRKRSKWYQIDWSIWISRPGKGRMLRAESTCLVGFLVWALIGVAIYFSNR